MRMPAGFKRRPGRRVLGATLVAITALGVSIPLGLANLPNSTFDAGDGNLVLNDEAKDWINAPDLRIKTDAQETSDDDSYAGGEKHDDVCPSAKTGAIPPNKDDLTRLYVADETVGQDVFVYMAWERFLDRNSAASAHMGFEFNRFRTPCAAPSKNVARTAGDVLILMDLEGGAKPQFELLRWQTAAPVSPATGCKVAAGPPCWGNAKVLSASSAEGEVNRTAPITDPVLAPGQTLPRTLGFNHMFGEAAVNLTAAGVFSATDCQGFGNAMLLSRSSGNAFNSTLKDFVGPLDVDITNCGALNVHKYIDIDESGSESPTNNETIAGGLSGVTAADLTGWNVTVAGPNGFSCTGTTDAAGVLTSCVKANGVAADLTLLVPGSYTVTENAVSKTIGSAPGSAFFNTDPGTAPAAPPVSEQVNVVTGQTASVNLGNTCYNTATFQVTGVPSGQTSLFARYWTTDPTVFTDVALVKQSGTSTYQATVGAYRKGVVVRWKFGINGDTTAFVAGPNVTTPGYPACTQSKSVPFGSATLSGVKYKDLDVDGVRDDVDSGTAGFTIQLKQGSNLIAETKSSASGAFSFSNVDPGTYTLHELSTTGWIQTEPASNGDITVNVPLGATSVTTYGNPAIPIRFGNSPLSRIGVTFTSLGQLRNAAGVNTGDATRATSIDCTNGGTSVGSSTNSNTNTTNSLDLNKSQVTCVITFEDP